MEASISKTESSMSISLSPNPFNPTVTISYSIPENISATYKIFDAGGKTVASYRIDTIKYGTRGKLIWRGIDLDGKNVASGVYIGKLFLATGKEMSKTMLLIR
jgi:hypothetical protein